MAANAEPQVLDKARAEGRIESILRFIRKKFGSTPKQLESKLNALPVEELDSWPRRVVRATSLEELFDGDIGRNLQPPAMRASLRLPP